MPPPQTDQRLPANTKGLLIGLGACLVLFVLMLVMGAIAGGTKSDKEASPVTTSARNKASTPKQPETTTENRPTSTTSPETTTTSAPPTTPPTTADPYAGETLSQKNARKSAARYLEFAGFSRLGLIDQLESEYGEGFSHQDAVYGVDSLNADWNAQAVRVAESYLEFEPFSRQGLIEQLSSEYGSQFTYDQAVFAVNTVGL